MTRVITAIAVVCIILCVGVLDQVNIKNSFYEVIDRTTEIERLVENENYEEASKKSQDLLTWWDKKRDILELTCPHNEVKDLMALLAQLDKYVILKDKGNSLVYCHTVKEDAYTKYNILAYRVKNIF